MNNVLNIKFRKRKRLTSLLGLALDGSRLDGVVLHRANDALQQLQTFSVTLSLDPLTAAPELVGQEIRNHLDAAGVRERYCVLAVPLKWALTAHTEMPQLPEADVASFLQLEAERGFPSDPATLRLDNTRCPLPDGKQYVLMAGIPGNHLAVLEQVLLAAKLKPLSFSPGLSALQFPAAKSSNGVLALAIGESQVGLQITCGGGVASLRALEGAVENDAGQRSLQVDLVARETRITLGQLPAGLRETVKHIRIFGPRDLAQQLADEMTLRFEPLGFTIEVIKAYAPNEFGVPLPSDAAVSPAFSVAAWRLMEQPPVFEFLPPKPTILQQIATKYSSGRLRTVGAVAAGILLLVALLFGYQQFQLIWYGSQWKGMSAKVADLQKIQGQIQKFRPWFDESFDNVSAIWQLTKKFPESGEVTAKTLDIRDGNLVTCSGTASDYAAYLRTFNQLRAADGVTGLKTVQLRGKSPMQFGFEFHWTPGGAL